MIYGYKSEATKLVCANCDSSLSKESEGKVQFCPKCGNPLTMEAAIQLENLMKGQKMAILFELLDEMEEGKDPKETINRFIGEMKNN